MSNNLYRKGASPGPAWATLQEALSSGEDVGTLGMGGPPKEKPKKRKGVGDRDVIGHDEAGPSSKRPRRTDSTSSSVFNTSSQRPKSGLGASLSPDLAAQSSTDGVKSSTAPSSPKLSLFAGSSLRDSSAQSNTRPSKPSRSVTQPVPASTFSSATDGTESTASRLAALWNLTAPSRGIDPGAESWKEKYRDRVKSADGEGQSGSQYQGGTMDGGKEKESVGVKGKEKELIREGPKGKGETLAPEYFGDLDDGNISSSAGPTRSARIGSTSKRLRGPSHFTSRSSLTGSGPPRNTKEKGNPGPLFVNERRQFARKSGGSSKPPKQFRFDRQLTPSSNGSVSGTDSSSSTNTSGSSGPQVDRDQVMEGDIPEVPSKPVVKHIARKSAGWPRPSGTLAIKKSIKGKEREQAVSEPKLQDDEKDIIVIGSSEDEDAGSKPLRLQPNRQPLSKDRLLSPVRNGKAKVKEQHRKMPSGQLNQMNLIDALNKAYQKQVRRGPTPPPRKALEDNIIDLTLDDSDEASPQAPKSPTKSSFVTNAKQEQFSPARPLLGQQLPGLTQTSPPPITPPILAPSPSKEPQRPQSAADFTASSPSKESTLRPRSAPMVSALKPDLETQKSDSTESSRFMSSGVPPESPPIRRARAGRILPGDGPSDVEESDADQAMAEEPAQSSRRAQSSASNDLVIPSLSDVSHTLPEVIPPLRRSLRHSSGSSHSETDNLLALTDAESPPDSSPSPGPDDVDTTPSYGGFKALTWEHHRKNLKNFQFKQYFARDIPTSLPDAVNRLSEYTRMNRGMQDVFRAYILENIVEDEAGAPDVEIINDIDPEPTPLFEFNYSNKMWYGEGVPLPDYNKLKGCDCVGRCDPKSRTCSCAERQRGFLDMDDGFVYEKNGRLKHHGYPIFECNELCACEGDCRNRVVQNGRRCQVNIRKTRDKGWGVFNGAKRIPRGTFIGIYAGELLTDEQSEFRGRYYNKIGKTYLFDIDFWHLKSEENPDEWRNKYVVDAYHAGNFTRFLNHSCDPNARLYACYINEPDVEKPLLVVFSTRDIDPHEEICFNYQGNYPEDERDEEEEVKGEKLKRDDPVYTECKCGARNCTGAMFR